MKYDKTLCVLLILCLLVSCLPALSEEDVEAVQAEEDMEEITFSLGDAPAPAATEVPEANVDELEKWDDSDYYLSYPDVMDKGIRALVTPSERVYPGTLIWPLKGREPLVGLTSHVGWRNAKRIHGHQGGAWPSWLHHGVDVGGVGTDQLVVAAAGGVAYAGQRSGLGKYVVIDHGNGWYTRCQHLSAYAGDITDKCRAVPVEAGDPIGYVGKSGGDYPVHFHFEIAWSPDGPGSDDADYQRETHNFKIRAYSFAQDATVLLRWADRWELCTAENQEFVMLEDEPEPTPEPSVEPSPEPSPEPSSEPEEETTLEE